MIPLLFGTIGDKYIVKKISGSDLINQRLKNLGLVVGTEIEIISVYNGNLIVRVLDTRIALEEKLAKKIMV